MENDCLQILDTDYLKSLRNFIKSHHPKHSIWAHNYLYNHLINLKHRNNIKDISDNCITTIYGPRNKKFENCTFIGITGNKDYSIVLFTLEEKPVELIECVRNTQKINWSLRPAYIYMESRYATEIEQFLKDIKIVNKMYYTEDVFYISRENILNFSLEIPEGIFIRPLTLEDALVIDQNWLYKYSGSLKLIKSLIKLNGGLGICKENTNELIAWIVTNQYYCPGFLHTVTNERSKGYANLILKAECQRITKDNDIDVCCYVSRNNNASQSLLKKIGFEYSNQLTCIDY